MIVSSFFIATFITHKGILQAWRLRRVISGEEGVYVFPHKGILQAWRLRSLRLPPVSVQ